MGRLQRRHLVILPVRQTSRSMEPQHDLTLGKYILFQQLSHKTPPFSRSTLIHRPLSIFVPHLRHIFAFISLESVFLVAFVLARTGNLGDFSGSVDEVPWTVLLRRVPMAPLTLFRLPASFVPVASSRVSISSSKRSNLLPVRESETPCEDELFPLLLLALLANFPLPRPVPGPPRRP